MSNTVVYKYELPRFLEDDNPTISLPRGAKILRVGLQGDGWWLWALVDPRAEAISRQLLVVGTDQPNDRLAEAGTSYICTSFDDPFVWHVFEVTHGW
jgi:hypothetical protein